MAGGGWSPEKLTAHLRAIEADEIYMTFAQLDAAAGVFPDSAHKYPAYWTNSLTSRPHSRAWLDAGFLASPEFVEGRVHFQRGVPSVSGSRTGEHRVVTIPSEDPGDLPPTVAEPYHGEIAYAWHDVGDVLLDQRERLDIPTLGSTPGVYRFTLFDLDGEVRSYYVGESESLFRRMCGYNNPGPTQSTNIRINRILSELLKEGGGVRLAVVMDAALNGKPINLSHRPARLLVENFSTITPRRSRRCRREPRDGVVSSPGPDVDALLGALSAYRAARIVLLEALGCSGSNRDPFAEFAERIALAAVGGSMARSRTQKGWDFTDTESRRVQVRYLANPAGPWVNEHLVDFRGGHCDRYALLVVEAFEPKSLLVFEAEHMGTLGAALAKRHGDQEHTLQLTQRNYKALLAEPARFAAYGVQVLDLTRSEALGPAIEGSA